MSLSLGLPLLAKRFGMTMFITAPIVAKLSLLTSAAVQRSAVGVKFHLRQEE